GWLGIEFHYLPAWKNHREEIRQIETQILDEETGEISYEYTPEYEYTPTLETLQSLKLEVADPYAHVWTVQTESFNPTGKRIAKKQAEASTTQQPTHNTTNSTR